MGFEKTRKIFVVIIVVMMSIRVVVHRQYYSQIGFVRSTMRPVYGGQTNKKTNPNGKLANERFSMEITVAKNYIKFVYFFFIKVLYKSFYFIILFRFQFASNRE